MCKIFFQLIKPSVQRLFDFNFPTTFMFVFLTGLTIAFAMILGVVPFERMSELSWNRILIDVGCVL